MITEFRPGATAAHIVPLEGDNTRTTAVVRTINGPHYSVQPQDPTRPAWVRLQVVRERGPYYYARADFDPATGWVLTQPNGRKERLDVVYTDGVTGVEPVEWASAHIRC